MVEKTDLQDQARRIHFQIEEMRKRVASVRELDQEWRLKPTKQERGRRIVPKEEVGYE